MAYSNTSEAIEALAQDIAENVYIDIAKWHLYLGDAKLHVPLAEQIYPLLDTNRLSAENVNQILREMKVPIAGGRDQLSLIDLLPTTCQNDLMRLLEDFRDHL